MNTMYQGCHYQDGKTSASVDFFPVPLLDESMRAVLKRELEAKDRPDVIVMSAGLWLVSKEHTGATDAGEIIQIWVERLLTLREVNKTIIRKN